MFFTKTPAQKQSQVVFYNLENLFDTESDSTKAYKEFNSGEIKSWDNYKYYSKINSLAKVIVASTDSLPDFLAFAEVENEQVVAQLVKHPLLFKGQYEIIHFESDDIRGIDVAFAFQKKAYNLLAFKKIKVELKRPTRDILYVKGIHKDSGDTVAFFINHWPSRYGGRKKSERSRIKAANTLKHYLDSTIKNFPKTKIIVTGDFNDTPKDSSCGLLTNSKEFTNLILSTRKKEINGTIKYKRQWQHFDQFIVSNNLINTHSLKVKSNKAFTPNWILEQDYKYGGNKPFRTYQGPIFKGGYSDHLPIVLTLIYY